MDLELRGKRAIVTGASRGIGYAVAEALLAEGADVVVVARGRDGLSRAAARLRRYDGRVVAVPADTNDDDDVREMVARTVAELGGVDVLVNSAAQPAPLAAPKLLADLVEDDLRREIETKVLGYLRCARAAAPHMAAHGWGRIINISGLAARQTGSVFGSIRNVAVAAMTKNLADELGPLGINVTVVHPGMTVTERTPGLMSELATARGASVADVEAAFSTATSIGRIVTAAQVADVVAFLASPRSVAITGDAIAVGGGVRGSIHY